MKTKFLIALLAASSLVLPSCMTTYDASGRPVQSVDPGLAAVGIIGAGLVGAAIASDNNHDRHRSHKRAHRSSSHSRSHSSHYERRSRSYHTPSYSHQNNYYGTPYCAY